MESNANLILDTGEVLKKTKDNPVLHEEMSKLRNNYNTFACQPYNARGSKFGLKCYGGNLTEEEIDSFCETKKKIEKMTGISVSFTFFNTWYKEIVRPKYSSFYDEDTLGDYEADGRLDTYLDDEFCKNDKENDQ